MTFYTVSVTKFSIPYKIRTKQYFLDKMTLLPQNSYTLLLSAAVILCKRHFSNAINHNHNYSLKKMHFSTE